MQGGYEYHHYGQGARDEGWGCAYRTCQTIFRCPRARARVCVSGGHVRVEMATSAVPEAHVCVCVCVCSCVRVCVHHSWYKLRNPGCVRGVPSIGDMQRQLVHIGDKPASFAKSTEWIGSVEISLLLDSMLGISCKILHTENDQRLGDEVASALVDHFRTAGSPVMVGGQGGGARAIIGLELFPSGELRRFLVLDPHYAGADSVECLKKQMTRVCVWVRPRDLCQQYGKFTNFCLPLDESATAHGVAGGATGGTRGASADEWHFEVVESS